jgi:hypothetical protein
MPTFSKKRRPIIPMHRFNPYLKVQRKRQSDAAKDAGFDALWNAAPEAPK